MTERSLSQLCEAGSRLAARVGLGEPVCEALVQAYEHWDGKGYPDGLTGDAVPIACESCRSPGTPSCGNAGPGGRSRSRC